MDAEQQVRAVQLSAGLRGMPPPVIRRLRVAEQTSLAELHAALQVAFGWSDGHLYTFQIRGWLFGDPGRRSSWRLPEAVSIFPSRRSALRSARPFSINTTCLSRGGSTAASKREVKSPLRGLWEANC